jgi:hypothetical protein
MHPAPQWPAPVLVPDMVCAVTDVPGVIASCPQHQQEAVGPLTTPAGAQHTPGILMWRFRLHMHAQCKKMYLQYCSQQPVQSCKQPKLLCHVCTCRSHLL